MDVIKQALFERMLAKYECRYGSAPPIASTTLDEAIEVLRDELSAPATVAGSDAGEHLAALVTRPE